MGGNFNSIIGNQRGLINGDENDKNYLPQGYDLDTIKYVSNNEDISVNEYSQHWLDLCIATNMKILNLEVLHRL